MSDICHRAFSRFFICATAGATVALLEVGGEQRAQLLFYLPLASCSQFRSGEAKLMFSKGAKTFGICLSCLVLEFMNILVQGGVIIVENYY
jgi:hypothetical protein